MPTTHPRAVEGLVGLLGSDRVIPAGPRVTKYLRDFSWYSPVLESEFADTTVEAIAIPHSVEELTKVVAIAARHRMPLTMRGAGTGNYGQSLPLRDGLVVDVRKVAGVENVTDHSVVALAGTKVTEMEQAARQAGRELAVMPSTYRIATVAGFVSGGSGGPGQVTNGNLWDGNVLSVELLTVEEEPRVIRLVGEEVNNVLHLYGTVGVITRVELRTVPAHEYGQYVIDFENLADCVRFGWRATASTDIHLRLASIHSAPLGATMTGIADLFPAENAVALLWADPAGREALATLVAAHGGHLRDAPEAVKEIVHFSFSHAVIWIRRVYPHSSWMQAAYTASDPDALVRQVEAIAERYPDTYKVHLEFATHPGGAVRAWGVDILLDMPDHGAALDELMTYCRSIGVRVLNPHSYVVEEGGFVGDIARMLALKATCDPYGILNPGKLATSFYVDRTWRGESESEVRSVAPEQLRS
ncbi:FAD-binding oxidoreductase [Cryptosporangium sp. NPDC051539]|uniref:FAD-binding oxidoreductase n=1 Tax=Cryptosporangium sp. NPDC051539 TaxID=3363962 RepID=UPI0037B04036